VTKLSTRLDHVRVEWLYGGALGTGRVDTSTAHACGP
jgi:hypothetical protein